MQSSPDRCGMRDRKRRALECVRVSMGPLPLSFTFLAACPLPPCQAQLNAEVPRLEQEAVALHAGLVEASRHAEVAAARFGAVAGVRQELGALATRLGRLQLSLAELERAVAAEQEQRSGGDGGGGSGGGSTG